MPDLKAARSRGAALSPAEVAKAVVIDFEGEGAAPGGAAPLPALVGTLIGTRYRAHILCPDLHLLGRARRGQARFAEAGDWNGVFEELARVAESEGRVLLHFSRHEHETLAAPGLLHPDLQVRVARLLADGKALLERGCLLKLRKNLAPGNRTLEGYASLWCRQRVERQAELEVGRTIRELRRACRGRKRLASLPEEARARFDRLLEYNRADLDITRRACEAAAKLIASRAAGRGRAADS